MTETPPICMNCQFFGTRMNGKPAICMRPTSLTYSPVYGESNVGLGRTCASERAGKRTLIMRRPKCGAAGTFFVKRGPPPPCGGSH